VAEEEEGFTCINISGGDHKNIGERKWRHLEGLSSGESF
jgi:hypothetical protein